MISLVESLINEALDLEQIREILYKNLNPSPAYWVQHTVIGKGINKMFGSFNARLLGPAVSAKSAMNSGCYIFYDKDRDDFGIVLQNSRNDELDLQRGYASKFEIWRSSIPLEKDTINWNVESYDTALIFKRSGFKYKYYICPSELFNDIINIIKPKIS